ncbi:MAG: excisionase family DNA-binding protein [Acidobacteria bacterium]|nr:excisionase family DNA-binding protein [Acidobacteriota bacterium]
MIRELASHPSAYVTVRELAVYLSVSRRQVRKWMDAEALVVVSVGPRQARITRESAQRLERQLTSWPPQALQ